MTSRPRPVGVLIVVFAAAGLLSGGPAAADWLVTTAGSAVETRGSWEVKGRLVLFHTLDGTFASIRLSEVDLELSEARTQAAESAAKARQDRRLAGPESKPKAKFVLTDADVGHVDPETMEKPPISSSGSEGDEEDATARAAAVEGAEGEIVGPQDNPLEVASWDAFLGVDANGILISGTVHNPSEFFASDISVNVTVLDLEGGEIEARAASMAVNALAPGERGGFEVLFPGVFSVGDALFDLTSFNALLSE